jgi:hypothetical protein
MGAVVHKLERPLSQLAASIRDGKTRIERSDQDWVWGSLEICSAMHEARLRFPHDRGFGQWLNNEGHNDWDKNDRAALIKFGADSEQAREVFTKATSKSYQHIWDSVKSSWRFPQGEETSGPRQKPHGRGRGSPRRRHSTPVLSETMSHAELHRKVKLEEDLLRIQGTTLDYPQEMDALIHLKDHYSEDYQDVIARAVAGESVSAVAVKARIGREPMPKPEEFVRAFTRQQKLLAMWLRMPAGARVDAWKLLMDIEEKGEATK